MDLKNLERVDWRVDAEEEDDEEEDDDEEYELCGCEVNEMFPWSSSSGRDGIVAVLQITSRGTDVGAL